MRVVVFSEEELLVEKHFSEDAAKAEYVDCASVVNVMFCKEQLRRSINKSRHVMSVCRLIGFGFSYFRAQNSGKPKIADLNFTVFINQNIARLQVSVHDLSFMNVPQPIQNLEQNIFDMLFSKDSRL